MALGLEAIDFFLPVEVAIFDWLTARIGESFSVALVADWVGYGVLVVVTFGTSLVLAARPSVWAGVVWWLALAVVIGAASLCGALLGWWLSPLTLWVGIFFAGLAALVYCSSPAPVGNLVSEQGKQIAKNAKSAKESQGSICK
jgi:energy-coupling factor transporter transmembrane protein EcfT